MLALRTQWQLRFRFLWLWLLGGLGVLLATARQGSTDHISAFLLRAAVVLFIVGAGLELRAEEERTLRVRDLGAPSLAVVVVLCGMLVAPNRGVALQSVISVVFVVSLYLTLLLAHERLIRVLLGLAAAVGAVHSVWAIAQNLAGAGRGTGGFFNPNDLAAFLAPLFVLALGAIAIVLCRNRVSGTAFSSTPLAASLLGLALLLGAGILATGSRSGILAASLGLVILAVCSLRRLAFLLLLALGLAIASSPALRERFTSQTDPYGYARQEIWSASVDLALRSAPAGVGLGFFDHAMRQHGVAMPGWVHYPKRAHNAHSEPLNAWVELGYAGLVACLLAPLSIAVALWRRRRPAAPIHSEQDGPLDPWAADAATDLAVLVAFAVPALVSASLHVPAVALLAAVWAARAIRADRSLGATLSIPARSLSRGLAVAALVALLAAAPGAIGLFSEMRALGLRGEGRVEDALAAADVARKATPWSLSANLLHARLRLSSGAPALEVVDTLVAVSERFPYSPDPVRAAASILAQEAKRLGGGAGHWHAAAGFFEETARRDPRNALVWTAAGLSRERAGEPVLAEQALQRALEEEPNCGYALAALARLARARGDEQAAASLEHRRQRAQEAASAEEGVAHTILSSDPNSDSIPPILGELLP